MSMVKRIFISVSSDVVNDQRVLRTAGTLKKAGLNVILLGRKKPGSLPLETLNFTVKRFRLLIHRGFFFYASLNLALFFYLLFSRRGILLANDLDTILPNYLVSRIRRLPLVYDSHEYFLGSPELEGRKKVKSIWRMIEKYIVPKIKTKYTVNESIAGLYKEEYGTVFDVVRNVALRYDMTGGKDRHALGLPADKHLLILQGTGINRDRGAEEAVMAMEYLDHALLLIIGSGEQISLLRELVKKHTLEERVRFVPRMPYHELMQYTAVADVGLSLDKDTSLNYRYSLPNKLFDYIQARVPVLASSLPEVRKIIETYQIGMITPSHDPLQIANIIRTMLGNRPMREELKKNLESAARELCWEKEEMRLLDIFRSAGLLKKK
jgi:glycosyltransferase involved in cell wall biosynthesis